MKVQFDCYKCIFNQIVEMARQSSDDDRQRREILKRFIDKIVQNADDFTPPEMAADFYDIYCAETGIADPYEKVKQLSTELAVKLYPELKKMVAGAADPFETALRLAVGGNVIDFGANPDFQLDDAVRAIRETTALPLDQQMLMQLKDECSRAGNILYILDNCGEAVIDRLLIDVIGKEKITLGVRGKPILNDITVKELAPSGLDDLPVIDTGHRAPGVSLRYAAPEFIKAMKQADLVIAKGQGNFESLNDAAGTGNIYFLFRVKCPVIQQQTGGARGSLQIRKMPLEEKR